MLTKAARRRQRIRSQTATGAADGVVGLLLVRSGHCLKRVVDLRPRQALPYRGLFDRNSVSERKSFRQP